MTMNSVPSKRIHKSEDIFVCPACDKMYTIIMIDSHFETCSKRAAWEKKRQEDEEEQEDESETD
jgi:uncharacterized protein with PIN domain